ncbi:MAG: molybdenum cofactor guanylyltransferase [Gemmatimonadota bacterium]
MNGSVLGAVLAGGESRRYGRPKAGEPVGGVPMVRRVADALAEVCEKVVVISSREVPGAEGLGVLPDRVEGAGPLGGLHAALLVAREDGYGGVFLAACDLPLLEASTVRAVVEDVTEGDVAVVPADTEGRLEPLCAYYATSLISRVEEALGGNDRSLHSLIKAVGGRTISLDALGGALPQALLNVNRPADRERAEKSVEEGLHG